MLPLGTIERDARTAVPPRVTSSRHLLLRSVLHAEDSSEPHLQPSLGDARCQVEPIRRIGERDIIRVSVETLSELQGVAAHNTSALPRAELLDVRAQRVETARGDLNEVAGHGTARERLESERARSSEEIDYA